LLFFPCLLLYGVSVLLLGGRLDDGNAMKQSIIAVVVCLICMRVKFAKDSTTRELMIAFERQRSDVIEERIKRCEAEFAVNRICDQIQKPPENRTNKVAASDVSSVASKGLTQISAPAAFMIPRGSACSGDDCLLGSSLVYVDALTLRKVKDLQEGSQVLCQDGLKGSFEFVKVSIQGSHCPAEITRISLEDDTIIEMTTDHPMPVVDGKLGYHMSVVEAKDLQPGIHALSTWKQCEIKIKEVRNRCPSVQEDVFAVTCGNPERYKMMVAGQESCAGAPTMMAVGFANLGLQYLTFQDTFVNVTSGEAPRMVRSVSDPGTYNCYETPTVTEETLTVTDTISEIETGTENAEASNYSLHLVGRCKPCNFNDRYRAGRAQHPCTKGSQCPFCHELHPSKGERKRISRHFA